MTTSGIYIATDTGTRELSEAEAERLSLALRSWADDLDDELGPRPTTTLGRRRRRMARDARDLAVDLDLATLWATVAARR